MFGEIRDRLLLLLGEAEAGIVSYREVWVLLLRLEILILIVFALSILSLILRLLFDLGKIRQFLLIILDKLSVGAIPLSDFLDLVRVDLHVIKNDRFDIVVIFLHDVFVQ